MNRLHLANRGAGLPDGGLFTSDQIRRSPRVSDGGEAGLPAPNPARGVIEAKSLREDVQRVARSEQVGRYQRQYGTVLVTNFRSFALFGASADGECDVLESFSLADSESEFWRLAAHPRKAETEIGDRMLTFLRRVLLHNAPLVAPRDVASILASYAHDARLRIEEADLPALSSVRQALEESLGLRFEGRRGEHFFRSTLVQTLFYGLFSAWVIWARKRDAGATGKRGATSAGSGDRRQPVSAERFDWRLAPYLLRVPILRALFVQVAEPDRLGALDLVRVLDLAASALNRVDRAGFFGSFDEGHAVQYFYEPFLQAFDPELRKELGVWYTPEEIVRYQVERVDTVLRTELGLADGLADPKVVVLDPCCGTGAYLRAVLRRMRATLHEKGGDALVAHDLKKAAMERVFGFEILPAPFVIAHLQLGLELEALGAPLSDRADSPERAGVYLTNALTGWAPPKEKPKQIAFPGFDEERDAAGRVKQEKPILVILGNPPYNGFAGVAVAEESDLTHAYRTTRRAPAPQGQGLNDLYVRFFRMAERCITGKGRGVVSYISNYSWLDGLSFTGMRERFLEAFDEISIDCLNGDKYKTGKLTPEGKPDPSVFSTAFNREGIQVGTAIATLVKRAGDRSVSEPLQTIRFRHFWGVGKRVALVDAQDDSYHPVTLRPEMGLSFMPAASSAEYFAWPRLPELLPTSFSGVKTARDGALVSIDEAPLRERMAAYFNPAVSDAEAARVAPALMEDDARFNARKTRIQLTARGIRPDGFVRYYYRPFDVRWLYWDHDTKLLDEKRSEYLPHVSPGNPCIVLAQRTRKGFNPPIVTARVVSYHVVENVSLIFPLCLREEGRQGDLLGAAALRPNLSPAAIRYIGRVNAQALDLLHHIVAILHAPGFCSENAGGLRQDWPRVPMPGGKDVLAASATLGRQVAALLNSEASMAGVTAGKIREELRAIGIFERVDGRAASPEAGDLDLTAGWGHAGKGGVTMPGRGKAVRRADGAYDVFLNDVACWRNVPEAVWEYTLGGYQVIKKWLSYREKSLLGRGLTPDEVRYVTEVARRLAALVALGPELDDNYRAVASDATQWDA